MIEPTKGPQIGPRGGSGQYKVPDKTATPPAFVWRLVPNPTTSLDWSEVRLAEMDWDDEGPYLSCAEHPEFRTGVWWLTDAMNAWTRHWTAEHDRCIPQTQRVHGYHGWHEHTTCATHTYGDNGVEANEWPCFPVGHYG